MPLDLLLAFTGFALASAITPGPNNIMLMASGVNYGFARTLPHLAGVAAGFYFMLLPVGLGLGQVLQANQDIYLTLKIASIVYLMWLAWRVATSGPVSAKTEERARPFTFLQAVLFQWVNVKAWAMAVTSAAVYTDPSNYTFSLLVISTIFVLIGTPCMAAWVGFGVGLRAFLQDPRRVRIFNITMAILLVLSFLPVVLDLT